MVEELPEKYVKSGHRFDTGPFLLDLYRLFGIVLGDRQLVEMGARSYAIKALRDDYVFSEFIRILTSTAIALRILFDQHQQTLAEVSQRPCGEVFPDWPKTQQPEELILREACNKIIHATKVDHEPVQLDPGYTPDQLYLLPYVHLYGKKDERDWKAKLSIIDFARSAATSFQRTYIE